MNQDDKEILQVTALGFLILLGTITWVAALIKWLA